MDEKTLVFGHRKPDTDSITASIIFKKSVR